MMQRLQPQEITDFTGTRLRDVDQGQAAASYFDGTEAAFGRKTAW